VITLEEAATVAAIKVLPIRTFIGKDHLCSASCGPTTPTSAGLTMLTSAGPTMFTSTGPTTSTSAGPAMPTSTGVRLGIRIRLAPTGI